MEYYLLIVSMKHFADEARLLENEIALKTFDFGDLLVERITVKSRVLTRVTNKKNRFLGVFIHEMCFKTRCGSIVFFGISFQFVFSEKKREKVGYDSIFISDIRK